MPKPIIIESSLLAWIVFSPLLGFLVLGLFGKKFSPKVIASIACGSIFISFVLSFWSLVEILGWTNTELRWLGFTWIQSFEFSIGLTFRLDALSVLMVNVISGVGFLIHLYSIGYMKGDEGLSKFFAYMNLFCFAMLVLVMADNLVLLFLGWEGVGLCSYLLIGFWYKKEEFATAGRKAFVVNRIGDFAFLIGIFLIFQWMGTLNIPDMQNWVSQNPELWNLLIDEGTLTWITLLLFIGATGKSAQIPLHVWLPDAMAGPTPVSALIHAATMVTAGVYMIGRLHFLFASSEVTMFIILVVASLTAFVAATIALVQNDIKKVLAYSTISQLGYMFMAMAIGAFSLGIFHLLTHAFFKALLFLAAGSVILAVDHEQDMTRMGGLTKRLPITHMAMLIGVLSLSGVLPFVSGFVSKDLILEQLSKHSLLGVSPEIFWVLAVITALLTALYSFRLMNLSFWTPKRNDHSVHEPSPWMSLVLILLAFLSLFGGLFGIEGLWGGSDLHQFLKASFPVSSVGIPHIGLPTYLAILMALMVSFLYLKKFSSLSKYRENFLLRPFLRLLERKYYIDEFYNLLFVQTLYRGSSWLWQWVDSYFIDGIVNGTAKATQKLGKLAQNYHRGDLNGYAFSILLGVLVIFVYYWFFI